MKKQIYGEHLKNLNIAFVVLDNINAYKAPKLITELRQFSCNISPHVIKKDLKYVTKDTLKFVTGNNVEILNNQKHDATIFYPVTKKFIDIILNESSNKEINNLMLKAEKKQVIFIIENFVTKENIFKLEKLNIKVISPNVQNIVRVLSKSNLKNINILVTAGPTPVKIDNVRRITNKFSGKLGIEIANELYLRGANVMLYQSNSGIRPPKYIEHKLFDDYDEYKKLCVSNCLKYTFGIFSAAVADYKPKNYFEGKIPSGGAINKIELIQTEKVINLVKTKNPNLKMISFKYEEGKNLNQLLEIADKRLHNGHLRVVANDLTLNDNDQKCFLCGLNKNNNTIILNKSEGKISIARMIANDIEDLIKNRKE